MDWLLDMRMSDFVAYILSAFTIYIAWQAGSKRRHTWLVGIAAQLLWLWWIVESENWGLLGGNITLAVVYTRNYFAWGRT